MPRYHFLDGTSKQVSIQEYRRLQAEADKAYHEAYALAAWFVQREWEDEFGEDNPKFPFNANKLSIFTEAERLLNK